jgi:hypothetical protein
MENDSRIPALSRARGASAPLGGAKNIILPNAQQW